MAEGDLGLPPPPKIGVSEKRTEREIDNIRITYTYYHQPLWIQNSNKASNRHSILPDHLSRSVIKTRNNDFF